MQSSAVMIHSQDSFHDLEEVLRSLQVYSAENSTPLDHDSTRTEGNHGDSTKSQHISTPDCNDEFDIEDILMEILLRQKLHTSKEYTLNGLRFKVYVLEDTEL